MTEDRRRGGLRGEAGRVVESRAALGGWHPVEWLCELVGTGGQLFLAFVVVAALESPLSPLTAAIPNPTVRLALIGLMIGLLAALVAVSPLGRRSGAHLNPAVTIGFWARGSTHVHDLLGYVAAQVVGAVLGALAFGAVMGEWARTAGYARTELGPGVSAWRAFGIEVAITFLLVLAVLLMTSSHRTARWTPAVIALALTVLVPVGGPPTGASMNPARTLGPDVASGTYPALWVYLLGPALGAVLAALAYPLLAAGRRVLTAKVFLDERYHDVHAVHRPPTPAGDDAPG
ncbi:aquaporin [Georgenia sp. TF02-10]|uniref:MIP/aquaporin family protein n=1 Tax=Georgenia sp. TF02-10 TaxID=2917725 RepID=UPI001FA7A1F5|nr:aquaporin [Georgenia sp. TF02-10]UNX56106.1 aquaporin [Georgenia sp. TF02-10]